MPISDSAAVKFGLLTMYAEDMYDHGKILPKDEPRIKQAGWQVVAYLAAVDARPPVLATLKKLLGLKAKIRFGDTVFYGFLAQSTTDPKLFAVVVRGTSGIAEWIIDADFVEIPYRQDTSIRVEEGFWTVYNSMMLVDTGGQLINKRAADGIADKVGKGRVTIAGHSLGSALATYLSLETANKLGPRASACLFASPRTGDEAWASLYDKTVSDYRLFNYILDAVPQVPFDAPPKLQYSTLHKATIIEPAAAQADIRVGLACSHHVICYCAMLDYAYTAASPKRASDLRLWACVLGRQGQSLNSDLAKKLAFDAKQLDGAKKTLDLLKLRLR